MMRLLLAYLAAVVVYGFPTQPENVKPDAVGSSLTSIAACAPVPTDQVVTQEVKDKVETTAAGYWFQDIAKQGIASFNGNPAGYKIFRNVKDYGAKGDGVTDDSDAINRAIADQNRCGPWVCQSTTTTPAIIYFPGGTYVIGQSLNLYYFTQLHGNPNDRPVLKASPSLRALALIDASRYNDHGGAPGWVSTNLFMRQIRNFVIDLTPLPPTEPAQGIHWPASQATSIQNVKILMTPSASSVQVGLFIENGSGGYLVDIETVGGLYGFNIGNQQFTMRGVKISKAVIGISQIWNWGWLYQGITISDCGTAFSMINLNALTHQQQVGSVVIIDSDIINCQTFVDMVWTKDAKPTGAGQLILENIALTNVPIAVKGNNATVLAGGTLKIAAWGQGNKYSPDSEGKFQGSFTPTKRPAGLLNGDKYFAKQKPQYEQEPLSKFTSIRTVGARGDGRTDDTAAVQNAINAAARDNKILFFDHGNYKVTDTIYIPPGARMVGESFSVILAAGNAWSNWNNPKPVIQVGKPGERGSVEWSDMVVATQGPTPGAKIIEYNLETVRGSGLWDVHTRIGGAAGTNLQTANCPIKTQKQECMVAHTNVHITKSGTGAYFENNWFWTADHDLDDVINNSTRISVFAGRGMLVEATNVWLWASGVEHHGLYQYQFANAKDVFAGFIQTETPYWQPKPDAAHQPYPLDIQNFKDPDYARACPQGQICDAYGLRILDSQSIHVYGAGLYSFFQDYDVTCSNETKAEGRRDCQWQIFSVEGTSSDILIYTLSEVGALQMATVNGQDKAGYLPNLSVYSNTIGLFSYKA